jgi:hypothetical protein
MFIAVVAFNLKIADETYSAKMKSKRTSTCREGRCKHENGILSLHYNMFDASKIFIPAIVLN